MAGSKIIPSTDASPLPSVAAPAPTPAPSSPPVTPVSTGKKILIIEDDLFISDMYVRGLTRAGYQVDTATTGPKGFDKARTGIYDLILLDIFLPEENGIDVLHKLRSAEVNLPSTTKVVIMTNYAHDDESRAALQAQADGYFIKADITPNKLVSLVKQLIG